MDLKRYSRQTVYKQFGAEGQQKLLSARVAVIGIGALGTVIANNLCRAGVGFLRLIDRDIVELTNLQRQTLFDEDDAAGEFPKAVAACQHLSKVNSEIILEPVVTDVNGVNIESLISDTDLVLDGTDNAETRYLVNEACHKLNIPWIYGGALGASGMTMNILYGDGPCFCCLRPAAPAPGSSPTCSTFGVMNAITGIIASIESMEALKILIGSPQVRKEMLYMNIWESSSDYIEVKKNPACPVCVDARYEFLGRNSGAAAMSLCGRDSVQVTPETQSPVDLKQIADKLRQAGEVRESRFMLIYEDGKAAFNLFPDGRAIIKNVKDEAAAKSVYAEYIGL